MKFVSWNVNGLRACMGKGFMDSFNALNADFFCLQETKLQEGQITMDLPGYHQYWCYAEKKGYSGTAVFTRHEPRSVRYGLGIDALDTEGRVITLEYDEFFLVTCYTPNAQRGLARIDHRLKWEEAFRLYLADLDGQKPVILCGDLNVAHKEIDLKNPASNRGNAGFSDEERSAFTALLESGFTDSFRHLYPDKTGAYSWWSYMFNARQNNAGWRIDYFVVSNRLADAIHDATIHPDIMGSDHCPVGLDLNTLCNGGVPIPPEPPQNTKSDTKADGTSPVGLGRILFSLALAAVVIGGIFWLPRLFPSPEPEPRPTVEMVDIPPMDTDIPLINAVTDRTGQVKQTIQYPDLYSSRLPDYYYVCGEEWFRMETLVITGPMIQGDPNFYVQIAFTDRITEAPTVTTQLSHYSNNVRHYIHTQFYYDQDGSIGGCFVYGYLTHSASLSVTVSDGKTSENAVVPVTPHFDFTAMSTTELLQLIDSSQVVPALLQNPNQDGFIQSEPTMTELTKRPDAISSLLDYYRECRNKYAINVTNLLQVSAFQTLMTDDQREDYESLKPSDIPIDATMAGVIDSSVKVYTTMPQIYYLAFTTAGQAYINLGSENHLLHSTAGCLNGNCNYCLRLDFTDDHHFSVEDLPELSAVMIPTENVYISDACVHANYYYDDDGKIAGLFVYGHTVRPLSAELMLTMDDNTVVSKMLHIDPFFLFSSTATD